MTKKNKHISDTSEQLGIDEDDNWFDSFLEILSSGIKILMVGGCLLIVKSLFDLAIDMFNNVEYQDSEVIKIELIAVGVLAVLAIFAFWLIGKDD